VIQNEIGEVGLDGKLLDYTVTEIDEGCVCFSLAGNLKRAVNDILMRFQPDFIILETTGAAKLFQYVAGRFELSLFPQPSVGERFLIVIAQGECPDLVGNVWKVWKPSMESD